MFGRVKENLNSFNLNRGVPAVPPSKSVSLHEHELRGVNLPIPEALSVPVALSECGHLSKMTIIVLLKDTVVFWY